MSDFGRVAVALLCTAIKSLGGGVERFCMSVHFRNDGLAASVKQSGSSGNAARPAPPCLQRSALFRDALHSYNAQRGNNVAPGTNDRSVSASTSAAQQQQNLDRIAGGSKLVLDTRQCNLIEAPQQ
ncbi:hypothetical protein DE146DRAFT_631416 [Phaeosphaeria sp. MPI-PUGE-AT-0046c]|nr:hypothetical protein DE146DRAFT_631416 [Phaeosphaeria sp. MPI-PUGE-AT-0046c]